MGIKRIALILLLLIVCVLVVGCKSIDYGIVVEKSFTAAHSTYAPYVMIINKQTKIMPRWVSHPDSWKILVKNDDGSEWWSVSEEYYNSVNVGDNVDRRKKEE